jgi:hypothetical protein
VQQHKKDHQHHDLVCVRAPFVCYFASMHPAILDLLERQHQARFPDFAGAEVAATIPVSDRLINELIAGLLPNGGKVREVQIQTEEGNRLTARIRLSGATFLPAIPVTLAIEGQPDFPERPILGLRLSHASRFVAMAASTLPTMVTLPPGVSMEEDRIRIDIRRLLADRDQAGWLGYVTDLRVTTRAGALVLDVRAKVGSKPTTAA